MGLAFFNAAREAAKVKTQQPAKAAAVQPVEVQNGEEEMRWRQEEVMQPEVKAPKKKVKK